MYTQQGLWLKSNVGQEGGEVPPTASAMRGHKHVHVGRSSWEMCGLLPRDK